MKTVKPFHFPVERPPVGRRSAGGFSLVEIIIVVGLLSFIMLGLLMMFNQTQRAFRVSMTQTDVLESGRAVSALLNGSLEQMAPSPYGTNTVNFYMTNYGSSDLPPTLFSLPGNDNAPRTNVMESFYFLSRENQRWIATGYMVGTPSAGFGSLYRFVTNCPVSQNPQRLFGEYQERFYRVYTNTDVNTDGILPKEISRVVDGVVHFKVRVFDTNGYLITNMIGHAGTGTNIFVDAPNDTYLGGEARQYIFTDRAVPASVEFEIGVLEDRVLTRLRAIPDSFFQRKQLTNQISVGALHLFRQRVPVYNVDLSAY